MPLRSLITFHLDRHGLLVQDVVPLEHQGEFFSA